jgi:hypothetical protein
MSSSVEHFCFQTHPGCDNTIMQLLIVSTEKKGLWLEMLFKKTLGSSA